MYSTMFDVLHITCISSVLYTTSKVLYQVKRQTWYTPGTSNYRRHLHVVCSGIDCWFILYDSSSSYMYTYVEGWIHNDTRTNKKPILFPYSENSRNVSLYFHCTVATLAGWQPNVTHWYPSVYYWASVHSTTQHHHHHASIHNNLCTTRNNRMKLWHFLTINQLGFSYPKIPHMYLHLRVFVLVQERSVIGQQ